MEELDWKTKKRVVYYYDEDIGNFLYALEHPMKPHRVQLTHELIMAYGLYDKMSILRPPKATFEELTRFHDPNYIQFLKLAKVGSSTEKYNTKPENDSPLFEGTYEFCSSSAGGSLAAARALNSGHADIAINWMGGLHHAKRAAASGFCYVNDCVLAILELLKRFPRVMYIDIDIHHGDGVEEAFYTTDRVLTVSFHKYGDLFFPITGNIEDIGIGAGKYYAVNVPLKDGMTNDSYLSIFKPVIQHLIEWYRPGAIYLQCGADSLTGDKLGSFELTIKGHAECVNYVKSFGIPVLAAGGGGYTVRNVSRCWAYETSVLVGEPIEEENIPFHNFYDYYGPNHKLELVPTDAKNMNTDESLEQIKVKILDNLRHFPCAPSIQCCADDYSKLLVDSDEEELIRDDRILARYINSTINLS